MNGLRQTTRRQFLGGAAGAAVALAVGTGSVRSFARPQGGRAPEVLVHDEVQGPAALAQGRFQGTRVEAGLLRGTGNYAGPAVTSPFAFTHVGLHWKGGPGGAAFEIRTSPDGAEWTPWQRVFVEAGPEETPAGETYGALISAPRHTHVEYRAELGSQAAIATVTATMLNSLDGPELEQQATTAGVDGKPITFTREDWGADERLRFHRNGRELWPRMYVPVKKLLVHHTATSNDYTTVDGAKAEVRAVYTYHAKTLGWGDIGYNALVDLLGNTYEGRYGRDYGDGTREIFGQDVVAGHASSHNYGSCGVAGLGNFETLQINDSSPVVVGILKVLEYAARLRGINPQSSSDFLRSDANWNVGLENVCGHRDTSATACPGQYLYFQMGAIRQTLADRLANSNPGSPPAPALSGPDGISQSTGDLAYDWVAGEGSEFSYCLEGWSKSSSSEDIQYLKGFTADRLPEFSPITGTTAAFTGLTDGHYTFHLRTKNGTAEANYGSNRTVLISGAGGGTTKPGAGKKPR